MYLPIFHREDRLEIHQSLIDQHPLGLLISNAEEGLVANALPFFLHRSRGKRGSLLAHMACANGQWQCLDGQPVLVCFQGPQAYVSPSSYATKRETGKVVPTWNYVMVQVRGTAQIHTDPAWLQQQVELLTDFHEGRRPHPWAVSDAPAPYTDSLIRAIVGVEIEIASSEGKWKISQNRSNADRQGVAADLMNGYEQMANLVRADNGT